MLLKLLHEVAQATNQGKRSSLAEATQRHLYDMIAPLLHDLYVFGATVAQRDPICHMQQVLGADTAWYALAARLVPVEAPEVAAHIYDAHTVVVDYIAAGTHSAAVLVQRVEVHNEVEMFFRQAAAG